MKNLRKYLKSKNSMKLFLKRVLQLNKEGTLFDKRALG